jgi:hypothetical protein
VAVQGRDDKIEGLRREHLIEEVVLEEENICWLLGRVTLIEDDYRMLMEGVKVRVSETGVLRVGDDLVRVMSERVEEERAGMVERLILY